MHDENSPEGQDNPEDVGLTPLQEAHLEKILVTYKANIRWLAERFPKLLNDLNQAVPPLPFDFDEEGRVRIYYGKYYGGYRDLVDLGRLLLENFSNPETRASVVVDAMHVTNAELVAAHRDSPYFYQKVEPPYRMELIGEFVRRFPEGKRSAHPGFGKNKIPIAVIFGSGFGWHIDRLVDDFDIKHLIIIDTDINRLDLSLYFTDWIALEQRFYDRGGLFISRLYASETTQIIQDLLSLFSVYWPPYFIQGAGIFYNDYDSEIVQNIWKRLKSEIKILFRGWGFLDDELLGIRHCVTNMLRNLPVCTHTPRVPAGAVAVVVGGGPSIDALLPLIHENREHVVVISCGTAVYTLGRAGIRPDFHIEIERTKLTHTTLQAESIIELLRDVPFIATTIVDPGAFTVSSKPLMLIKDHDAGASIIDFERKLPKFHTNPTVTNGGVELALRMGFEKIFLFGVDLGFRDQNHHHSQGSPYYSGENKLPEFVKIIEDTHRQHADNIAVDGNFAPGVLSTDVFIQSRDMMEASIAANPNSKVFNLNDGARIRGAVPLMPEDAQIVSTPELKAQAIDVILSAFSTDYDHDAFSKLDNFAEQVAAIQLDVKAILDVACQNKMDVLDRLAEMHTYFHIDKHRQAQVFPLLRGSMLHLGRYFFDCLLFIDDDAEAIDFARFAFDLFLRYLADARKAVLEIKDVDYQAILEELDKEAAANRG